MVSEWREYKLRDVVASANTGLDAIKRAPIVDYDTGVKCLRIQDVSQKKAYHDWGFCEVEKNNYDRFSLKKGEIYIARTGASIGVNLLVSDDMKAVFNNGLIRLKINEKVANQKFVYYNLCSYEYKGHIESISGGTSTQPNMQINALLDYEIIIPPLPEQQVIAEILSSFDDNIDLLTRQNATLEALAQTYFRQWFMEGESEDWVEVKIDDIVTVKGGTTPSTAVSEYWNGNIAWSTPKDLSNHDAVYLLDTERKITSAGLAQIGSGLLPVGTVLLSSRAPIGYLAIADIEVAINQGYIGILCDKGVSNYFIYLWCQANMDLIEGSGNGSTFQEISKSTFKSLALEIPDKTVCDKFDVLVEPLFSKVKNNQHQIRTLQKLRDTLLPKLVNGEVKVKER